MSHALKEQLVKFLDTDYTLVSSEDEAKAAIKELKALHEGTAGVIEDALAALAVKFQIDVYLGEYGNGRHVHLRDSDWSDEFEVGEWVPSSATC